MDQTPVNWPTRVVLACGFVATLLVAVFVVAGPDLYINVDSGHTTTLIVPTRSLAVLAGLGLAGIGLAWLVFAVSGSRRS